MTSHSFGIDDLLYNVIVQEDGIDDEVIEVLLEEYLDSSDDDDSRHWGGSPPGKAPNKDRDFAGAYKQLVKDYFSGEGSVYDEQDFDRRFRMSRNIFDKIMNGVGGRGRFKQRHDCTGKAGIHPLCRITAVLRMIGYGDAADRQDEYLRISETETIDSVKEFSRHMVQVFGNEYLCRNPTQEEKARILALNEQRLFPGQFASWDCKHFVWKNCPIVLAGQHRGHGEGRKNTLILEAIADLDLYCWFLYFGDAGSLNDINVLDKSSIVASILDGTFDLKTEDYEINGHVRDWMYFLADGIYPDWAIFVKTIGKPITPMELLFAMLQEGDRKDVERFFGVLVSRFHILGRPLRFWYMEDICNLLYCCVIMHNMIVEEHRSLHPDVPVGPWLEEAASRFRNERRTAAAAAAATQANNNQQQQSDNNGNQAQWSLFGHAAAVDEINHDIQEMLAARVATVSENMMNANEHYRLKNDLMIHIWNHKH
jgi:hypothetical protein